MLGMSPLQLSATLAAVVAGRPPFSLLAAAAPGATGPAQHMGNKMKLFGAALFFMSPAKVSATVPDSVAQCPRWVHCNDGMAYSDANFTSSLGKTCVQACAEGPGECCTGGIQRINDPNTCFGASVSICADGSCTGPSACVHVGRRHNEPDSPIGTISGGSCSGVGVCRYFQSGRHGDAAHVYGQSCVGDWACHGMSQEGTIGNISGQSCRGNYACDGSAYRGVIGDFIDSCKGGDKSCERMGRDSGSMGDINNSCKGYRACFFAARSGSVGDINDSCRGTKACDSLDTRDNLQPPQWPPPLPRGKSLDSCCIGNEVCKGAECTHLDGNTYWDRDGCNPFRPLPESCPTPTPSPTEAGPLSLAYDNVKANFTAGASNELEVGFFAGVGHEVTVNVYETCDKGADEVSPSLFTENVEASPDPNEGNLTHSKITVGYNFNKAEMTNSSLWNSTSETLTFCQSTKLRVPNPVGGDPFVILEDKREIEVKFDLDATFEVDVDLGDRTIRNETEFINFDNDVEAYKCRGGSDNSFSVNDEALPPNTELAICIIVQNNTSVIIDRLAYMVIAQGANLSPNLPMVFVNDGNPMLGDGLTKISKESQGVILKTRLPQGSDYFQFESGLSLNISGTVDLELATGRKLRALAGENNVAGEEGEVAEINVVVGLQSTADGFGPIGSSDGHAIVGKGLAAIGLMVLAVTGVVMM